jgi:hypothetical protein
MRTIYECIQFDTTICGFLEGKTLEGLIDRQHHRIHWRCASLGHLDGRTVVAQLRPLLGAGL